MKTIGDSTSKKILLIVWVIFGVLIILDFLSVYKISISDIFGNYPFKAPRRIAFLLITFVIFVSTWLFLLNRLMKIPAKKEIIIQPNPFFANLPIFFKYLIFVVILVLISIIFIIPGQNDYISSYWIKVTIYILACLLIAYFLLNQNTNLNSFFITTSVLLVFSGFIFLFVTIFAQISNYPFSLYWSEGNRFWDYSLAFGKSRYIFLEPRNIYAYIEPGRQILWGLPFIINNLSITGMRVWDSVLWIIPSLLLGFSVSIFENGKVKFKAFFIAIWFFIFLNQGPIYAPLIISAVIIYIASKTKIKILTIVLIIFSSIIASISRWTWAYVPSVWISILLILKIKGPIFRNNNIKNLIWVFICSTISLLSGQINRIINMSTAVFDNNPINIIQIPLSSRQPLLFARLFPNSTFSLGLLIGIFLAVVPILLLIFNLSKQEFKKNSFQYIYTTAMLLILFVVGCIASIKIGGGNNLHNFDMFLVTITLIFSTVINKIDFEKLLGNPHSSLFNVLIIIALISPVLYGFQNNQNLFTYDETKIDSVLKDIENEVIKRKDLGEILFIDQRQLLTFGYINNIPLVDDYEKKLLMDKSLSSDYRYFENFYKDLFEKRFLLIVNENSGPSLIGDEFGFSSENNLYSLRVLQPLFCFYEPLKTYKDEGILLLIPRDEPLKTYIRQCPTF